MTQTKIKHSCIQELRDVTLKVTPARLGVLAVLEQTDIPLDIATIADYLKQQAIKADPATVFRIMNMLTGKGLVTPIQLNEGKLRYEYSAKADHHHLICENCGKIEDIEDCNIPALEQEIQQKKKFIVKRHALEFFGVCHACSRLGRQRLAER